MKIANFDTNERVFIIAELSGNHCNDYDLALKSIHAAKEAGADAVKVQTYTADTMTLDVDDDMFRINQGNAWDGKHLYELYEEGSMPWDWQPKLKEEAEKLGLVFFSSPFDPSAVDFLEEMNIPVYKIASYEINDIPLLEKVAALGKPIIISTGIAGGEDIELAVKTCRESGNNQIMLLKCTSAYPAPYEKMNLLTMVDMKKRFNVEVGLSDHSTGATVPIAAVALGARVLEKHFILDKELEGIDQHFSMDPDEFAEMVQQVRNTEAALGKVDYEVGAAKQRERKFARSLFAVKDIKMGEQFTEENVRSIRPNDGLAPKYYSEVLGGKAKKELERGTPLSWDVIER